MAIAVGILYYKRFNDRYPELLNEQCMNGQSVCEIGHDLRFKANHNAHTVGEQATMLTCNWLKWDHSDHSRLNNHDGKYAAM